MPRTAAVLFACISLALMGAAPPRKTPTPAPSATPTMNVRQAMPIVVVFPFESSSDIKAGTGEAAAQVFMRQMNADGGIDTIEAPASIPRAGYLKYAASVSASYYVSGYMTPLGNGVSLVEQVVSTRSDAIVSAQTVQIESIEDAAADATQIHDGILAREQAIGEAYSQAQAQATPTPESGNQADIGKGLLGLAGLFHHKGAAPTPVPAAAKPAKGVIVVRAGGALPASDLASATAALASAMNLHYNVRSVKASSANLATAADAICGTQRDNTIATGKASATVQRHGLGSRTIYTFVLEIYTCFGAKLTSATGTAGSLAQAVQQAVALYAERHPHND